MSSLSIIYDNSISPTAINVTNYFKHGKFIYFTSSDLTPNQYYELGVSCIIVLPTLNGNVDKLWSDLGTLRTNEIIPLPSEIADFDFNFYLAFGTQDEIPNLMVYVCTSNVTLETIDAEIKALQTSVGDIQTTTTINNYQSTLQNAALSIIGTGLIPITGGVTSPVPLLFPASTLPLLTP